MHIFKKAYLLRAHLLLGSASYLPLCSGPCWPHLDTQPPLSFPSKTHSAKHSRGDLSHGNEWQWAVNSSKSHRVYVNVFRSSLRYSLECSLPGIVQFCASEPPKGVWTKTFLRYFQLTGKKFKKERKDERNVRVVFCCCCFFRRVRCLLNSRHIKSKCWGL